MECHKDFEGSSRWTAASERFCNITHTSTSTNIWPGPTLYVVFNMASCCDTCFCWSCGVFQWWQQNFEHPIGFCWALHWSCWWRLGIPESPLFLGVRPGRSLLSFRAKPAWKCSVNHSSWLKTLTLQGLVEHGEKSVEDCYIHLKSIKHVRWIVIDYDMSPITNFLTGLLISPRTHVPFRVVWHCYNSHMVLACQTTSHTQRMICSSIRSIEIWQFKVE